MKAEDIFRIWEVAQHQENHAERIKTFARACEQHGIERAKQLVYLDAWESLDAEVEEENRRET